MIGQAKRLYELNSLVQEKDNSDRNCPIISVTSGKGGTGKSVLSANIAVQLSLSGVKVLLIDLDINLANLNVFLNVSNKKTLYHYFTYNQSLDDLICSYNNNLDLILGESGKIDHPKLNENRVDLLFSDLNILAKKYDIILIDTGSGIDSGTLQLLLKSDEIILVTSPEPTSVMDAYVIFKMLKNFGSQPTANIVINKCLKSSDGGETFENLKKATNHFLKLDIEFMGEIDFSTEIIQSIRDQKPVIESNPTSKVAKQIQNISSKLKIPAIG